MDYEAWSAVDGFIVDTLAPHDEALAAAVEASEQAGLPAIQVSPPQGKPGLGDRSPGSCGLVFPLSQQWRIESVLI